MGKFIIRIWRILLDIQGSYALIRQLVGSGTVTVVIGRLIWYWTTLPLGLRVLLIIVLFCLTWLLIALFVNRVNRRKWDGIINRVKQDKQAMKILDTVEAMDTSLSEQIPKQIELHVTAKTKRKLTDEFMEIFGMRINRRRNDYKKHEAIYIAMRALAVTSWRMALHRQQVLADIGTLLNTSGVGLANATYDSLNKKLDKLLKFARPTTLRAVYGYLDYSNGFNNLVLFMKRDLDIDEIKRFYPSFLWLKIKRFAHKRDQIMRVLYNQLALEIGTKGKGL
jgi:hypothetical protein